MTLARPFAYYTGTTIPGTEQVGNLSIGTPTSGFTDSPQYWNGPDEELGYVIVQTVSGDTQPTPFSSETASVGFFRTEGFSDQSFIDLTEAIADQTFATADDAKIWLGSNGYYTTYDPLPTPTPTETLGNTPTPTSSPSVTPTETPVEPTPTPTPTPTETPVEPTPTPTETPVEPTPTPTETPSETPTPTPTPGVASLGLTVTINEFGSDVIMSASGTLNVNDLTLLSPSGTLGQPGLIYPQDPVFIMSSIVAPFSDFANYGGILIGPANFGTGGVTTANLFSGDIFGIVTTPFDFNLFVPPGYITGTPLSSTLTFNSQSFTSLGLIPGTYTYSWGTGLNADSVNVVIS